MLNWFVRLAGVLTLGACYPDVPSGVYACTSSEHCPSNYSCDMSTHRCILGFFGDRDPMREVATRTEPGAGSPSEAVSAAGTVAGSHALGGDGAGQPNLPISGASAMPGTGTPNADTGLPLAGSNGSSLGDAGMPPSRVKNADAGLMDAEAGVNATCPVDACGSLCTDLNTDRDHCGACDHACRGVPCMAGRCQPTLLANTKNTVKELTVGSDGVYWSELSAARKVGLNGGAVTELSSLGNLHELALDATHVYSGQILGALVKFPRAGGEATTLVADGITQWISISGDYLYYLGGDALFHPLLRVSIKGGTPEKLSDERANSALALDATHAYFASASSIQKVSLSGGPTTMLVGNLNSPSEIAVDAQHVYWADKADLKLMQVNLDGSSPSMIADAVHCSDIAADGHDVYWVDHVANGTVKKRASEGGPIVTVADGQANPVAIGVDDAWVYWVNNGPSGEDAISSETGQLLKVAK